jgi:hypothetical protein
VSRSFYNILKRRHPTPLWLSCKDVPNIKSHKDIFNLASLLKNFMGPRYRMIYIEDFGPLFLNRDIYGDCESKQERNLHRRWHYVTKSRLSRNALKSSNLMGGRPLYISVRGGGTPPPRSPDISTKRLLSDRNSTRHIITGGLRGGRCAKRKNIISRLMSIAMGRRACA